MVKQIYILHIETSTEVCSVAISSNEKLIAERNSFEGFEHSAKCTQYIQDCLSDAQIEISNLDAVCISEGPGSYTGLRVGFSIAKGICFAQDIPMIMVSTLEALAHAALKENREALYFSPMIDARRMEVYTATYDRDLEEVLPLQSLVLTEESFNTNYKKLEKHCYVGNGAIKLKPFLKKPKDEILKVFCQAKNMIFLGHKKFQNSQFSDTAYGKPQYLKPPNITVSNKKLLT